MAYSYVAPDKYAGTSGGGVGGQVSDYFKTNSYEDPYKEYLPQYQKYADQYLGGTNPLAGGAQGFKDYFGYSSLNPSDPRIGGFLGNLQGGVRNAVNENAGRMSNAGIASSRSGMGVRGVPDMRSAALRSGNETVANNYADAYGRSVDWTRDAVGLDNQGANAMADAYKAQLGVGSNMMQMLLQALQSGDASAMQWAKMQLDAFGQDTATSQRLREGQRAWDWQAADRQQQQNAANSASYGAINNENLMRRVAMQGGTQSRYDPSVDPGATNYAQLMGLSPYWMGGAGKTGGGAANSMMSGSTGSTYNMGDLEKMFAPEKRTSRSY
ncbi:MAG: hypothetical protein WC891_08895 [Actinomycetota bacterium]